MKQIYLTSDLHLGHTAMITNKFRPFKSTKEMNDLIIRNILKITPNYELYILGDVAFGKDKSAFITSLCWANFILGNHDSKSLTDTLAIIMKYKGKTFELVHNPRDATYTTDYIIHGHIHKTGDKIFADNITYINDYIAIDTHGNIFYNVNVEFHKYKPKPLNEIFGEINYFVGKYTKNQKSL